MTRTHLSLLCLTALGLVPLTGVRPQDEAHDDETPLAASMHTVEDSLRLLRRSLRDPEQTAASLATVSDCQLALLRCKVEVPAMAASVPEGERAAFVRDYRLGMVELVEAFLELERALLEGEGPDELKAIYTRIKEMEDPAHERFTEDG